MEHQTGESSSQFVLDNRKLIIAFALMILVCGVFFVIGFMEGKRQGALHTSVVPASPPAPEEAPSDDSSEPAARAAADDAKSQADGRSLRATLDWYENVNKREEKETGLEKPAKSAQPAGSPSKTAKLPAADSTPPASKSKAAGAKPQQVTYSVQVGAFRFLREAETKATKLKEKNYQCVIEPSGEPDNLFLLKVGKFASRADAVAMQIKLRKDGFQTFIKTNP